MTEDNNKQTTQADNQADQPQAGHSHTLWMVIGAIVAIIFVKVLAVFF